MSNNRNNRNNNYNAKNNKNDKINVYNNNSTISSSSGDNNDSSISINRGGRAVDADEFAIRLLHVCTSQLISQSGYTKSLTRCIDALSSIGSRHLSLLASSCIAKANLAQRTKVNLTDVLLVFEELDIDLEEVLQYVKYNFRKKKKATAESLSAETTNMNASSTKDNEFVHSVTTVKDVTVAREDIHYNAIIKSNGSQVVVAAENGIVDQQHHQSIAPENFHIARALKEELSLFPRLEPGKFPLNLDQVLINDSELKQVETAHNVETTLTSMMDMANTQDIQLYFSMKDTTDTIEAGRSTKVVPEEVESFKQQKEKDALKRTYELQTANSSLGFLDDFALNLMKNPAQEWPPRPKRMLEEVGDENEEEHPEKVRGLSSKIRSIAPSSVKNPQLNCALTSSYYNQNSLGQDAYVKLRVPKDGEKVDLPEFHSQDLIPPEFITNSCPSPPETTAIEDRSFLKSYAVLQQKFNDPGYRLPFTLKEYMFSFIQNTPEASSADIPVSHVSMSSYVPFSMESLVTTALPKLPGLHLLDKKEVMEKQTSGITTDINAFKSKSLNILQQQQQQQQQEQPTSSLFYYNNSTTGDTSTSVHTDTNNSNNGLTADNNDNSNKTITSFSSAQVLTEEERQNTQMTNTGTGQEVQSLSNSLVGSSSTEQQPKIRLRVNFG